MRRYPGPIAFSTEQESLFFGREDDIKELSELIFVERKVLLYSKSGYGKSSLLNAGVEPAMVKVNNNFEFIKIRFYDGSNSNVTPNDRFLMTVKQNADFVNTENQKTIIDIYAKDFLHEYWSVFKKNQMAGNDNKTYILIFDQFEELFSYPTEQINEFKNRLTDILLLNRPPRFFTNFEKEIFRDESSIDSAQLDQLYQPVNIKVVFSIRSDRLSELNRLTDKIPDIQKVFYELKPLSDEQLRKAIEIPANKPGQYESNPFTFTPKAVDKIISALTVEGKKTVSTTTLQIICQRIEGDFIPKEDGEKEYILKNNIDNNIEAEELPDFKDIFLDFYNQSVAKVETDTPEAVRIFIEDALISNEGTRISLDQSLCRPYVSEETLKTLVGTKLINVERNSVDSFSYELSHDTFIPSIKEMKDERIKQLELRAAKERAEKERIELEKEAKQQAKLLASEQARAAEAERAAKLSEENCRNQINASRKWKKLYRIVIIIAILAFGAACFAVFKGREAKKNEKIANDFLVKFLKMDADRLYHEEQFSKSMLRYKDLMVYTDKPDSIEMMIIQCKYNDSVKPLFDPKYSLADSLTNKSTIDNLINSDSIIGFLKSLDYLPAKSKLDSLITKHTDKRQKILVQLDKLLGLQMGASDKEMYPEAEKTLYDILKLNPTDQKATDLLKSVKHYNDSLKHIQ